MYGGVQNHRPGDIPSTAPETDLCHVRAPAKGWVIIAWLRRLRSSIGKSPVGKTMLMV